MMVLGDRVIAYTSGSLFPNVDVMDYGSSSIVCWGFLVNMNFIFLTNELWSSSSSQYEVQGLALSIQMKAWCFCNCTVRVEMYPEHIFASDVSVSGVTNAAEKLNEEGALHGGRIE